MPNFAELFAARVPRYTSYPTAPHFHAGVDEAIYRNWLGDIAPGTPLSLYLHIPFCDTLCWFCGCHTTVVNSYSPVTGYLDLLLREIDMIAAALPGGVPVTHIHWGGGSPTMLRPSDVERLGTALKARFSISTDAEFAVEIDPRGFNAEMADALSRAGLTRASIGLQDCNIDVQRAINRIQSREETANVIALLRERGVGQLNIDLIYGLPHQTVAGLSETIAFACSLNPDRFAVFGYAHVPHFKKHQNLIPMRALPDLGARFAQAEAAHARLCEHGYIPIGLDHFARADDSMTIAQREGRLARNFQGYTTDNAPVLLGLGASSIGGLPQGYVQNISDVPSYRAAVERGRLPIARGIALNNEDRLRRYVIERLMCDLSVDLAAAAAAFGSSCDAFSESLAELAPLEKRGIVTISRNRVTVRPEWRTLTRLVCAAFDTYLARNVGKHAMAV
jgi:oxygen-independent coproporphyrinogen-3 oxidase